MRSEWEPYWHAIQTKQYINYTPELLTAIYSIFPDGLAGKQVLEIGGGTGGNSSVLAKQGARVHILDFSPIAIQIAFSTIKKNETRASLVQADARQIPYPSCTFDLVFHQGFLEHFRSPLPLLLEQWRTLKSGGYVLVDVPQRYSLYTIVKRIQMTLGRWEYGVWETEFSYHELCELMTQAGFDIVCSYARGYYPWLLYAIRHLRRIENRLDGTKLLPERWWKLYEIWWRMFENSTLSRYTLQCIGIIARKPHLAQQPKMAGIV